MNESWAEEQVFPDGDGFFESLLSGIRMARQSIDFEVYIFNSDSLGERFAEAFTEASRRGVRVRVLVDGVGSPLWSSQFLPRLAAAGVHGKVYHPLPWVFWSFSSLWRRGFNRFLKVFLRMNRRDHRKSCVIDGRSAWLGSMNVSAKHLGSVSGANAWRDCGVRVSGRQVEVLQAGFEKAWRRARGRGRAVESAFLRFRKGRADLLSQLVRLNDTRVKRRFHQQELLRRMDRARTRIWITNAYFVPNRQLLHSLRFVAALGVDVRILVPRKSDVFFMPWVTMAFYSELVGAGVRVFEYLPTVLHTKAMIVDEWLLVGSSNLNYRSWLHDLEVDVVLGMDSSRAALEARFLEDQTASHEITSEELARVSSPLKWAGRMILIFRYWI